MGTVDAARLLTACYLEAVSSLLSMAADRTDPDRPSEQQLLQKHRQRHLDTLTRLSQECGLYDKTHSENV